MVKVAASRSAWIRAPSMHPVRRQVGGVQEYPLAGALVLAVHLLAEEQLAVGHVGHGRSVRVAAGRPGTVAERTVLGRLRVVLLHLTARERGQGRAPTSACAVPSTCHVSSSNRTVATARSLLVHVAVEPSGST